MRKVILFVSWAALLLAALSGEALAQEAQCENCYDGFVPGVGTNHAVNYVVGWDLWEIDCARPSTCHAGFQPYMCIQHHAFTGCWVVDASEVDDWVREREWEQVKRLLAEAPDRLQVRSAAGAGMLILRACQGDAILRAWPLDPTAATELAN